MYQSTLLDGVIVIPPAYRDWAEMAIKRHHYTHSIPSGKSHYFAYETAIIVYSIPANQFIAQFLLGHDAPVWELSRLWAPDGHRKNLLTQAIAESLKELRRIEPDLEAVVSYADPNVGHHGGVYRAASWIYTGQCEDGRYYTDSTGQSVARRKFHSGSNILTKAEILALGYIESKRPGRHRYVKPLTRAAKRSVEQKFL